MSEAAPPILNLLERCDPRLQPTTIHLRRCATCAIQVSLLVSPNSVSFAHMEWVK
jgi:hypothetical protein